MRHSRTTAVRPLLLTLSLLLALLLTLSLIASSGSDQAGDAGRYPPRYDDPADPPTDDRAEEAGTLMIMIEARESRAIGVGYVREKPDPLSPQTLTRTELLLDPGSAPEARYGSLRVQVLDAAGKVLWIQFVDDPFHDYVEVPPGELDPASEPPKWVRIGRQVPSFLLAIPDLREARQLVFTRFGEKGEEIDAGQVELGDAQSRGAGAASFMASDAEHATVVSNGPPSDRLDLLILADGYLDTTPARDKFRQDVNNLLAYLWTIPTYYELRSAMNVHVAFLASNEAGGGDGPMALKDTPFESYFNCAGIARLICQGGTGFNLANAVAADAPGNYGAGSFDAIAVLVDDARYGGGGGSHLTASTDVSSGEIFSHEFGHTAMDLADEYESEYNDGAVVAARTKANVSGPVADPADLKWSALVDGGTAIPTEVDGGGCVRNSSCSPSTLPAGTVGMYEGAGYTACGSFRPTTSCQMRCYVGAFCPVCDGAYHDALDDSVPTVDVYLRDNSLDIGNTPSPNGLEDPPGSGHLVRPWHSVDVVVDAPPFGDPSSPGPHENAIAGMTNRVFVTVHNRGSAPGSVNTPVELYFAAATSGAPAFPGASWTLIDTVDASVAGGEGEDTIMFEWEVPSDAAEHTCVIALANPAADPLPALAGGLSAMVRDNNNVTWKNLHVEGGSSFTIDMSNFELRRQRAVLRIELPDAPRGARLTLVPAAPGIPKLSVFDPEDPRQLTLEEQGDVFRAVREAEPQLWLALVGDLPAAAKDRPFRAEFTLKLELPGGAAEKELFVSVVQLAVDPVTGRLGDPIGGNAYQVTVE